MSVLPFVKLHNRFFSVRPFVPQISEPPKILIEGTFNCTLYTIQRQRNARGSITDHKYLENNFYFLSEADAAHAFGSLYLVNRRSQKILAQNSAL